MARPDYARAVGDETGQQDAAPSNSKSTPRPLSPGYLGPKAVQASNAVCAAQAVEVKKGQHAIPTFVSESEVCMTQEKISIKSDNKNTTVWENFLTLVHCLVFVLALIDFGGSLG